MIIEIGTEGITRFCYKVTLIFAIEMYDVFYIYANDEDEMLDLLAQYFIEQKYIAHYMPIEDMAKIVLDSNGMKNEQQIMQDCHLRLSKRNKVYVQVDDVKCFTSDKLSVFRNNVIQDALVENYVYSKGPITEAAIGSTIFQKWITLTKKLYNYALEINKQIAENPANANEYTKKDFIWDTIYQIYNDVIGQVNKAVLPKSSDLGWLIASYASEKNNSNATSEEYFRLKFEYFLGKEIVVQRNKTSKIIEDETLDHKAIRAIKAKARKKKRTLCQQNDTSEIPQFPERTLCSKNDILYIYKGNIRCQKDGHKIIQATAILHNKTDHEIQLNIEYCTECQKYILDYTVFEQYRNRYGALIGNFRMVVNGNFNGEYDLAEESPLMLSGYNVNQRDGYTSSERHYILARMIYDKIMDKGDIIRYLSYFIRKNGSKRGNEMALSKWEEDLAFVQKYNISTQPQVIINGIEKY